MKKYLVPIIAVVVLAIIAVIGFQYTSNAPQDQLGASLSGVMSDTTPPIVAITAPVNNATVSGTVTVSANATDNVGVTRVDFYYGTTFIGSDTTAPYSVSWNTTGLACGTYSLTARAYDAMGNMKISVPVSVTILCTLQPIVINPVIAPVTVPELCLAPKTKQFSYITKWGTSGSSNGQFSRAIEGVAVDLSGNVYAVDYWNNRIQKFTSNGTYVTKWGSSGAGNGQFNYPRGIAVDSSGNVYVVDAGNNRIQKFTSNGTYVSQWMLPASSTNPSAVGIAIDSSGNVYVANMAMDSIQKYTLNGTYVSQWTVRSPAGVATDLSGNVYVANLKSVQKFTSNGVFITQWGSQGSGNGQFNLALYLAVDTSGNVYVVDSGNKRIQKFTSDGTYLSQWGSQGILDGQFSNPAGIGTDRSGNVYVGDSGGYRIQKFGLVCK